MDPSWRVLHNKASGPLMLLTPAEDREGKKKQTKTIKWYFPIAGDTLKCAESCRWVKSPSMGWERCPESNTLSGAPSPAPAASAAGGKDGPRRVSL